MERHQEALEILNELQQLAQTQDESVGILQKKMQTCLTLGLYDDAVIALSTMPNVLDTVSVEMCQQIYVEVGIDAMKEGNEGTGRLRIKRALEIGSRNKSNETSTSMTVASTEEIYDIFIYIICNTEDEENGKKLMDIVSRIGLQATFNTKRLRPGTSELSGMTEEMKKSNNFAIIFDFDVNDKSVANRMRHLTERLQFIIEDREAGSSTVLIIKANTCDTVPDMFLGYKTIVMALQTVPDDFTKDENACKSMKEILIALSLSS